MENIFSKQYWSTSWVKQKSAKQKYQNEIQGLKKSIIHDREKSLKIIWQRFTVCKMVYVFSPTK